MVHSAEAKVAGVGAGESVGTSAGVAFFVYLAVELSGTCARCGVGPNGCGVPLVIGNQRYHSHHQMRDELLRFRQPSWLLNWTIWSGAASSDWAGGGENGMLGAEPKCESGVVCLLARLMVGVEVGQGIEVWLGTGNTCGVAAGRERAAIGTYGPTSSGAAAGEWEGLVGRVGIATLMGAASATSIFCMYSFLDQLAFSVVYLSPG
ncbi:hypothetical protein V6N11_076891 [Hibiscus sabdariffa]|uniref:Uncharacterized protein n=1 Tax=Hibiscus sabdariffa TaxID=183260 RepID=A0ABR2TC87_9ROSI